MQRKKTGLDKLIKISVLLGILIISLSISYYFVLFLPKQNISQPQEQKTISEENLKKQALIDFDKKITDAIMDKNYTKLYELSNPSTKKYFTLKQFIELKEREAEESIGKLEKISAENIKIRDNTGKLDRTYFICLYPQFARYKFDDKIMTYEEITKWINDNPDDSRTEKIATKIKEGKDNPKCQENELSKSTREIEYSYTKNSWQMYDPTPSTQSLEIASYFYKNISEERQKKMNDTWGHELDNYLFTIRNFALMLDETPEALADLKTDIEKYKTEKSRPIINVETPIQQVQPSWQDRLPSNNRINCITNTIGDYTYTDCH